MMSSSAIAKSSSPWKLGDSVCCFVLSARLNDTSRSGEDIYKEIFMAKINDDGIIFIGIIGLCYCRRRIVIIL